MSDYHDLICAMVPDTDYTIDELEKFTDMDRVSIAKLLGLAKRYGKVSRDENRRYRRIDCGESADEAAMDATLTEMIEAGDTAPDMPPAKPAPAQVPEKAPVQVKATPIALVKPKPAKADKGDEAIKAIGLLKQSLDNAAKYQCAGHINEFERKVEILSKLGSLLDSSITEYLDEIAVDLARIHALGGGAQHESA
jgi:hypothetical protein